MPKKLCPKHCSIFADTKLNIYISCVLAGLAWPLTSCYCLSLPKMLRMVLGHQSIRTSSNINVFGTFDTYARAPHLSCRIHLHQKIVNISVLLCMNIHLHVIVPYSIATKPNKFLAVCRAIKGKLNCARTLWPLNYNSKMACAFNLGIY